MTNDDMALPADRAGGLRPEPAAQSQPKALIPSAESSLRDELASAVYQYRDDLRRPPSPDSIQRRLAWIEKIITRIQQEALQ